MKEGQRQGRQARKCMLTTMLGKGGAGASGGRVGGRQGGDGRAGAGVNV